MLLLRRLALVAIAPALFACSTSGSGPADSGNREGGQDGQSHPPDTGVRKDEDSGARKDATQDADAAKPTPECGTDGAGTPDAEAPALASFGIKGLTLIPDFSPYITDYYLQCTSGTNPVMITAKAGSGFTVALSVETPGSPLGTLKSVASAAPSLSSSLSLGAGQAIVATVKGGTATQQYWVRCLPTSQPEQSGFPATMQWNSHFGGCSRPPGYYLIGFMSLPVNDEGYAVVFDTNGVPVWYKDNGGAVYDVETLAPGAISFGPYWQVDQLGVGVTNPVMDTYEGGVPSLPDEHELRIVDSTHYYGLSSADEFGVNLTGLSVPEEGSGGDETYGPDSNIYACYVEEFNPTTGSVYWKWSATDHFNPVAAMVVKGDGDLAGSEAQPFHCNAIDVDPANGNVLVSSRNMSSVFYIDHATQKVLWMMGGNGAASLDGATYVPVDDPFVAQHDARLLPGWKETCSGGSGQISLFDDESYTSNVARGVIYDVVINDGSGCPGGTTGKTGATKVFEYKTWKNTPTQVCGGMRVTQDNTRIIDWGQSDPAPNGLVFTEVDESGKDLLDFICPDGSSSFRAVKVPLSAFSLDTLRMTSGQ